MSRRDGTRPIDQLRRLIVDRDGLSAELGKPSARLADFGSEHLDRWAEACMRLIEVNAGSSLLLDFWQASDRLAGTLGPEPTTALGRDMADICREAGVQAARQVLLALPPVAQRLGQPAAITAWSRTMVLLAGAAPESVAVLARQLETVAALVERDSGGFDAWVRAGLRAAGNNPRRRGAFFSLADPLAWRVSRQGSHRLSFSAMRRPLEAYVTALWGIPPRVQVLEINGPALLPRRVSLAGGIIRMPDSFDGVAAEADGPLFRAAMAHAGAHFAYRSPRFPVGTLKPVQIALISLVEDARVEHLALRRFPGLRQVWAPFHVARPDGALLAPSLLARLARALFDADYQDPDGWVGKGRRLFAEAGARIDDPALAREIGGLLGNDLGQMRIRLEAKTYVVEPAYRDDNLGLWDFPEQPDQPAQTIEAPLEAARSEPRENEPVDRKRQEAEPEPTERSANPARQATAGDTLRKVATYPEWDYAVAVQRPDWTTVYEFEPRVRAGRTLRAEPTLLTRLTSLLVNVRAGQPVCRRRLPEGDQLDLDACVDAAIARRGGLTPEPGIYQTRRRTRRDVSVLILLDASASTGDRVPGTDKSVIELEAEAAALLAEAMHAVGDPFALWAFDSDGREQVRIARIKDFHATCDPLVRSRLAGLQPGLSTRVGAALRHAGVELSQCRTHRRLLLIVSDGEPFDIDVQDADYLIEDARRAVLGLHTLGIDAFCLGLTDSGAEAGMRIFGRANYIPARRLQDLPERLSTLYFRLAVR